MLGISEPTVRTHLQRRFSKTGTSKQADLLHLLHNSTPPIRALQTTAHLNLRESFYQADSSASEENGARRRAR